VVQHRVSSDRPRGWGWHRGHGPRLSQSPPATAGSIQTPFSQGPQPLGNPLIHAVPRKPPQRHGVSDLQTIQDAAVGILTGKAAVQTQSTVAVSEGTQTTALMLGGMAVLAVAIFSFRPLPQRGKARRKGKRRR